MKLLSLLVLSTLSVSAYTIYAASGDAVSTSTGSSSTILAASAVTRLDIVTTPSVRADEATDITVRAVNREGQVVPSYRGIIVITTTDTKATVPYTDGYKFKPEDNGSKTFSKGITFKNIGTQTITVFDADNDNREWQAKIKVEARDSAVSTASGEVSILTPENNSILSGDKVSVSGKAKKNSKVKLSLNNTEVATITSDENGNFTTTLPSISQSANLLQAKVYDGSDTVIGTSAVVAFQIGTDVPTLSAISISPGTSVAVSTPIEVTLESQSGLREASISLDSNIITLTESSTPGKYIGKTISPAKSGEYIVGVYLKNSLGKTLNTANALKFTTTQTAVAPAAFKNIAYKVDEKKITFTWALDTTPKDLAGFRFRSGTGTQMLSTESITSSAARIVSASGTYQWYITPAVASGTLYVQIEAIDSVRATLSGVVSSITPVSIVPTIVSTGCSISTIPSIRISTTTGTSILSWDALSGAISYNIYKKSTSGVFTLVENVKTPTYTVYIAADTVKYDDYGVKALCADGKTESADYAKATKVKTGPEMILFMVFGSFLLAFALMNKKFFLAGR